MTLIALRTDKEFEKVRQWVDKFGFGGYAVREMVGGANEHWHWLLETDKTMKAARSSFNREVPELKGNGAFSMSAVTDVEKYERYLSKGESAGAGPEVAWQNSIKYTAAVIAELHDAYWEENRKLKKRKAGSMIDKVLDIAKEDEIAWKERGKLATVYIKQLVSESKPINLFSMRSNLNTIQCLLCPDDEALKQLVFEVEGRF